MTSEQLKTWYKTFTNSLSDGEEAERKMLITAVNVGDSSQIWEVQGVGIEDSSIEYNPDSETTTDILGTTRTKVNKTEPSQEFDPNTLRGGAKLNELLDSIAARNAVSEFSKFEVLIIKTWLKNTSGAYYAEKHTGCTITPTSIGGSGRVDMPFNITFSNNKTYGTVSDITNITFTEATADE